MDNKQMKVIIRVIIVLAIVFPSTIISGQQEGHYSHNMFNNLSINPGFTGSIGGICASGIARQQWVGFKDTQTGDNVAPQTYLFSIHSPVNILHGGLGAVIYQDKLGYSKETGVKLMYAWRTDIKSGNLGLGLQVGFINGIVDFNKLFEGANDPDDEVLMGKNVESDMLLDFAVGAHYIVPEKYYIGLSASRLSESTSATDKLAYRTRRHYYLAAGYEFSFPNNPIFVLEPSILVKSDAVKTQYDVAALLRYNKKVWGGVSFSTIRVLDPLSVLIGFKIKDVRIGYSYTVPTSMLGSSGSHEVYVGYCFKIEITKGRTRYINTRYL